MALVLRDRDDLSREGVAAWLVAGVKRRVRETKVESTLSGGLSIVSIGDPGGVLVGIPVGALPQHAQLIELGIDRFAIDDFILNLVADQRIYESVSELGDVPHATAMNKLVEVRDLMLANGLPMKTSKRFLQILRAVTGFRAASATFAQRVMTKAHAVLGAAALGTAFQPVLEDIRAALDALGVS